MSDNGSCATDDIVGCVVDSERLIAEVEKRPALYNKKLKEYSDRNLKEKLWGEVCCSLIRNWTELPGPEKTNKGKEIQRKWKNLKDCFARELASQKKSSSGEAARKRRKYLYFDAMLFLLPQMEDRPTTSNIEIMPSSTGNKEVVSPPSLSSQNSNDTAQSKKVRHPTKREAKKVTSYEESLLNILQDRQKEEVNEDKNFALMLVPMLAKLNEEQKHYAKIEILNVMRNARYYQLSPIFPQHPNMCYNTTQATYNTTQATYSPASSFVQPYSSNVLNETEPPQNLFVCPSPDNRNKTTETSMRNMVLQFSNETRSPVSTCSSDFLDVSDQ